MNYTEFKHKAGSKLNDNLNQENVFLNKMKSAGGFTYEKKVEDRILVLPCSISKYINKFICRSIGAGVIFIIRHYQCNTNGSDS
jgi:hypothetical protein